MTTSINFDDKIKWESELTQYRKALVRKKIDEDSAKFFIDPKDLRIDIYSKGANATSFAQATHLPTYVYADCGADCPEHGGKDIAASQRAKCAYNKVNKILESKDK